MDYEFIDPTDLVNGKNINGNKILLTFNDVLLSQKRLAEKVLDPKKIKALFLFLRILYTCAEAGHFNLQIPNFRLLALHRTCPMVHTMQCLGKI